MTLTRADLWSLEEYAERRETFRNKIIAHKKIRRVYLGAHATLCFEDALTMRYQIQEMLRVEKIFTANEIEEELQAYTPLIPDGTNWKATFMIEYAEEQERREALARMQGIEHEVWVAPAGSPKIFATANEDMERSNDEKTAAVHFLRFEFDSASAERIKAGAEIELGIDHTELPYRIKMDEPTRASLASDLS